MKYFGIVWQKLFDGKSWYPLPPLIHKPFLVPENNETRKRSPTKFFDTVRQIIFNGKSWYSPLLSIPYQKFSETQNGSLAKFFRSCEIKKFRQNREASPFLCLKLFDTRNLPKHRRVLLGILRALWDKDFSTEFSDIPSLMHKIFRYPKFSDTPKCSPTKFFGIVRQKILNEKSW